MGGRILITLEMMELIKLKRSIWENFSSAGLFGSLAGEGCGRKYLFRCT